MQNEERERESSAPEQRAAPSGVHMKKKIRPTSETRGEADPDRDTMRDEYDFSRAMRGVTAARFREGTNVVILDPDVSALYPNSAAVNEALRGLAAGAKLRQNKSRRRRSQG